MQDSDIPTKMPTPWANGAGPSYSAAVPIPSQIGVTDGRASFVTGFPPLNFLPESGGGVPPFGQDMNGLLNAVTAWLRWVQAGGVTPYDAIFQAAIGGYPLGAIVASATTARRLWISTTENNVTNPDIGGLGWQQQNIGNSGVAAGNYVGAAIIVDAAGRITSAASAPTPTRTIFTNGSGLYNAPAGCARIFVRMVGAGGGRTGSGGITSFNAITALAGNPPSGGGAIFGGTGGNGGAGSAYLRIPGGNGARGISYASASFSLNVPGGQGADSSLGAGGTSDANGTGPGGGAGGTSASGSGTQTSSGGGGAGEYVEIQIYAPAANIPYAVGSSGAGATLGSFGIIIIDEFYN